MSFETPQKKESIEENTVGFMVKEMKLIENIPNEKFDELKKSGKLKKFMRGLVMVSMFAGIGGTAGEAEAGSWKMGSRGGLKERIVRELEYTGRGQERKIDISIEQAKEQLERHVADLEAQIEVEEQNLERFKAQTRADMSNLVEQSKKKIEEYEEEIEKTEKKLSKIKKADFAKDVGMTVIDMFTGGGSWRSRSRF